MLCIPLGVEYRTPERSSDVEIDGIEQVPAASWQAWLDHHGGLAIDVREPDEWAQGTFPGAELISLRDLPAESARLDPSTPLLLVCRSGNRSQAAAQFLTLLGFERAANGAGGMVAQRGLA